jgi:hypothetical protein
MLEELRDRIRIRRVSQLIADRPVITDDGRLSRILCGYLVGCLRSRLRRRLAIRRLPVLCWSLLAVA